MKHFSVYVGDGDMREILPSITTGNLTSSTWEMKIRELVDQRISRAALFLTYLDGGLRQKCYTLLEEARTEFSFTLPFIHASSTMTEDEYLYLSGTFGTQIFNLHSERDFPLASPLSDILKKRIYIENTEPEVFEEQDLKGYAGICFDLSHLKDEFITSPSHYERMLRLAQGYTVGVNHISAISFEESPSAQSDTLRVSKHIMTSENDFRYLQDIPCHAVAPLIAIEIENSLAEQLEVIPFITECLDAAHQVPSRRRSSV